MDFRNIKRAPEHSEVMWTIDRERRDNPGVFYMGDMTIAVLLGGVVLWVGLAIIIHSVIMRMHRRREGQLYMIYNMADVAEEAERWLRSRPPIL